MKVTTNSGHEGLTDPVTLLYERPVQSEKWTVPERIWIDHQYLHWEFGEYRNDGWGGRKVGAGPKMLEDFLRLAEEPKAIQDYANRWGILLICKHGLPAGHNPPPAYGRQFLPKSWCDPFDTPTKPPSGKEPISTWINYAAEANAILNIADRLRNGKPGKVEDWQKLNLMASASFVSEWFGLGQTVTSDKAELRERVNTWLLLGNVRPLLSWRGEELAIKFSSDGLFGALAIQLMTLVGGEMIKCDGCGTRFNPPRFPNLNRRVFCSQCRKGKTDVKLRMRDFRRRQAHKPKKA